MPRDPRVPTRPHAASEVPESAPAPAARLTRRRLLTDACVGMLGIACGLHAQPRPVRAAAPDPAGLPVGLLEKSAFVYISPLKSDGQESRCHGELWFAWLDDSVVVTVASDRWKAAALAQGLDRARIWVGDHGRWKGWLGGQNEAFRQAPFFDARAEKVADATTIDRLLEVYAKKYPQEIDAWRDRMRKGNADGSRVMLRYTPLAAQAGTG